MNIVLVIDTALLITAILSFVLHGSFASFRTP